MGKRLSQWSKEVKKAMIDGELSMGDLAARIGRTREWTSAVVNGRTRSEPTAADISAALGIHTPAYSNW